jgi:hypothetical protein
MTGDMQRYFSLAEKRHDFKDIDGETWSSCDAAVKDGSGRSKKLDPRVKPGNDELLVLLFYGVEGANYRMNARHPQNRTTIPQKGCWGFGF